MGQCIGRGGSGHAGQQAQHVERAAGFGAGAGQAFATKRLHADHCAHNIAVDVDVASVRSFHHLGNGFVDARVQAQRQRIAGGVDVGHQLLEVLALVAQDVQHWAEDFALELG